MKLTSLDLNLLVVFEAVFETRSVSRAAQQLGMRQPALSASLARLRSAFSDPLFVRAAGQMQPTLRAQRLAPRVAVALAELRAAMSETPFAPEAAARTFTIASTDYTTLVLLPHLMHRIQLEAPSVDIRVLGYDKDDIPELIDTGVVDVALGVFRPASDRVVQQFLCEERFTGIARAGHPKVVEGTMALEDFIAANHALVSVRRDAKGEIDLTLARMGLARRIALVVPHMLCLPAIVSTTDLLAAVPMRVVRQRVGDALQTFDLPLEIAPWRIEMLWNPTSRMDAAAAWLRTKLVEVAAFA